MANLKDLIVRGVSRFIGKIYASDIEVNGDVTAANISDAAGKGVSTAVASSDANLITSGAVYTAIGGTGVVSTYSPTGTTAVNGKAILAAIQGLDVADTAVAGQYVSRVSQVDGKISVTRGILPTTVSTYSSTGTSPVNGKAVLAALQGLDVSDTAVANQYVTRVSEVDGKISVTRSTFPAASDSVAGLTKVGASGGAAAYSHTHSGYADSTEGDGVADAAYMLYDLGTGTNVTAGNNYTPVYFNNQYDTPQEVTYAMPIPYVETDSTSTRTALTAQIPGITSYVQGLTVRIKNKVSSGTNTNCTLNINGLGALPIYLNTGNTRITTHWAQNAVYDLVYDTVLVSTGAWIMMGGYNTNSTYAGYSFGLGYGTCSTAEATLAKTCAISNYVLGTGGVCSVKFTYDVPANSTLNINSRGAKSIYYKGVAITDDIIKAGDTATFVYSGQYHLIAIDRWADEVSKEVMVPLFITHSNATFFVGTVTFTRVSPTLRIVHLDFQTKALTDTSITSIASGDYVIKNQSGNASYVLPPDFWPSQAIVIFSSLYLMKVNSGSISATSSTALTMAVHANGTISINLSASVGRDGWCREATMGY